MRRRQISDKGVGSRVWEVEDRVLRNSSHPKPCAGFDKECGALFEVTRPRVTLNTQNTNFRQGGGFEGVRSRRTSVKKLLPPQAMRRIWLGLVQSYVTFAIIYPSSCTVIFYNTVKAFFHYMIWLKALNTKLMKSSTLLTNLVCKICGPGSHHSATFMWWELETTKSVLIFSTTIKLHWQCSGPRLDDSDDS
jgi:hypothetical protein